VDSFIILIAFCLFGWRKIYCIYPPIAMELFNFWIIIDPSSFLGRICVRNKTPTATISLTKMERVAKRIFCQEFDSEHSEFRPGDRLTFFEVFKTSSVINWMFHYLTLRGTRPRREPLMIRHRRQFSGGYLTYQRTVGLIDWALWRLRVWGWEGSLPKHSLIFPPSFKRISFK